jgi:hypothetical protein
LLLRSLCLFLGEWDASEMRVRCAWDASELGVRSAWDASELNREENYFYDSRKNFGEISVPAGLDLRIALQLKSLRWAGIGRRWADWRDKKSEGIYI